MRGRALLAAFLLGFGGCAPTPIMTVADSPARQAWWLRAAFEPRGGDVLGIPARDLRAGWCAADAMSPAWFARWEPEGSGGAQPAARYTLPGPEVDGRATTIVLAVFRECAGPTGTAMLLLDGRGSRAPRVLAVEIVASPARYAMLQAAGPGRVDVVHCRECDVIDRYAWDSRLRRFVRLAAVDPDP